MKRVLLFFLVLLSGCKEPHTKKAVETPIENSKHQPKSISDLVKNISTNLKDGETLVLDFNLTMEDYIRNDIFHFTKSGEKVTVKAEITHGVEELQDGIHKLNIPSIIYSLGSGHRSSFETLIKKNLFRKDKKPQSHYVLRVYSKKDTLQLYSYNLADKGSFIKEYFDTTSQIFANENAFLPGDLGFPNIP